MTSKKILLILFFVLVVTTFVACGNNNSSQISTNIPKDRTQSISELPITMNENHFTREYLSEEDILFDMATYNQGELPYIQADQDGNILFMSGILSDQEVTDGGSALQFLSSIELLLHLNNAMEELSLTAENDIATGKQFIFQQKLLGTNYTVAGAGFQVITKDNIPVSISGYYCDCSSIDPSKALTISDIATGLKKKTNCQYSYLRSEAMIPDGKTTPVLVDQFLEYEESNSQMMTIDSMTGDVLMTAPMLYTSGLSESMDTVNPYDNPISIQVKDDKGSYSLTDTTRAPYIEIRLAKHHKDVGTGFVFDGIKLAHTSLLGLSQMQISPVTMSPARWTKPLATYLLVYWMVIYMVIPTG